MSRPVPMSADTLDLFLDLSAVLTGFELADLLGTGMGRTYLDTMVANAGSTATGDLLLAFSEILENFPVRDGKFNDAIATRIMTPFAPLAQNVITMWYLGRWYQLPGPWRAKYGPCALDQDQIISPDAYIHGLVWKAIDSNPRGARAPGYATWTSVPNIPDPPK